jgi:cation transport regulator ChaB
MKMKTAQIQDQAQKSFTQFQEGISQLMDRAKPIADDAFNKSKQLYNDTMERLPENSEKYAALAVAGIAVGMLGYQLGKKKKRNESIAQKVSQVSTEIKKDLTPLAMDYFSPAFKLVKLWMFYRLSI